ncbi:MAG: BON domain-containing protein [bacterium]|nr:BON domain-containing protein [bacterium]
MKEDWAINVDVRAELVKRWVDVRKINISTVSGVVYLKGSIVFREDKGVPYRERPQIIKQLEEIIKKLPGVKAVKFRLANWIKMDGQWQMVEKK